MDFEDSKTYQNLLKAYEEELVASTKYEIFGIKAREEGYEQMGDMFDETARNEREHGEIWLKFLHGGVTPTTRENLIEAATGANFRWTQRYREFARIARLEGYDEIAEKFEQVALIEESHDRRYEALYKNLINNEVFCRKEKLNWVCLNCGNVWLGNCAPHICPVCGFPQGYYVLENHNC